MEEKMTMTVSNVPYTGSTRALGVAAATLVAKGAGLLGKVTIITPPTADGVVVKIYDTDAVASAAPANALVSLWIASSATLDLKYTKGLVVVPSAGAVVSVFFS
jgi:hypothetical protein